MSGLDLAIVIPARGGSSRVKQKNIRPLAGKPLLLYTVEAALASSVSDTIVVSTDSDAIASVAQAAGVRVLQRPPALATDTASTESVLLHCLDVFREAGHEPEWIMTLPPTSPLRTAATIRRAVAAVTATPDAQDCLMTVNENRGDFWTGEPDAQMTRLFKDAPRRQQDRKPLWEENSALYLTRAAALRETGSILGRKLRGLIIDHREAWDINTELDFAVAGLLLAHS